MVDCSCLSSNVSCFHTCPIPPRLCVCSWSRRRGRTCAPFLLCLDDFPCHRWRWLRDGVRWNVTWFARAVPYGFHGHDGTAGIPVRHGEGAGLSHGRKPGETASTLQSSRVSSTATPTFSTEARGRHPVVCAMTRTFSVFHVGLQLVNLPALLARGNHRITDERPSYLAATCAADDGGLRSTGKLVLF